MSTNKLEKSIVNQMLNKADKAITVTYESLVSDAPNNKFSLELFDTYFAPYFFQGKEMPKDIDLFGTWIGIAGSPMAAVDIYDKNKYVFTVPPIYDTSLIDLTASTSRVSKVMDELSLYDGASPGKSLSFVENRLLPAADDVVTTETTSIDSKWAEIASRYKVTNTSVSSTGGIANNDDGLLLDED